MYEFSSEARPPFASVKAPNFIIHGVTHFDSSTQSMTEIYQERCIDIFESGRDFPCQFLSVGPSTYLIKFAKNKPTEPESCCKWSNDPFFAPRRSEVFAVPQICLAKSRICEK